MRSVNALVGSAINALKAVKLTDAATLGANRAALLALAKADTNPLAPANADFTAAIGAQALGINPPLNPAELDSLDQNARRTICSRAAFQFYLSFISAVTVADANKMTQLKAIADMEAGGDTLVALRNRLGGVPAFTLGVMRAGMVPMPPPGVPAPVLPDPLPHLNMLSDREAQELRRAAAEKYVRVQLDAIPEANFLATVQPLVQARNADEFRRLLQEPAAGATAIQLLKFSADPTDQLNDDQVAKLHKSLTTKCTKTFGKIRIQQNNALAAEALPQATAEACIEKGYIMPDEFKTKVLPALVRRMLPAAAPDEQNKAITDAQTSLASAKDADGHTQEYSVRLPGKFKLTEKTLDKNNIESKVTSAEDVDSTQLFDVMAKNFFAHFVALGQDPARQVVKVTKPPSFIDKNGVAKDQAIVRAEFKAALERNGFTGGVEYVESADAAVHLEPARFGI